ncbi:hypothetical protein ILYODFUR_035474 [Ilyodon furcidens]|uniref:Uncharacterized protein n=1 Tax=Ilyodon furcidens TaxID=33524 RepID=A0ABV0ULR8_9TELE
MSIRLAPWTSLLSCLGRRRRHCSVLQGCQCRSRFMMDPGWRFHVRGQVPFVAVLRMLPWLRIYGPAVKPSPSSRRKKRRRGAPSCGSAGEEVVSLPAYERAAASKPASSSATALSPRLAAASKPASSSATALSARLAARCSEATPDELEQRLRFYARQIKSLRKTCLMYSSPELMERIRQMERDYETAVRLVYCRPPLHTPCLQANSASASEGSPGSALSSEGLPG